jgi:hypothetical protein
MGSLIDHAVLAQQRGFYVFPIEPGEKACQYRWSQVASVDLGKIIPWWTATPDANIGVACRQSGLFIVDCDVAKAPWQLMKTEYEELHGVHGQMVDGIDVLDLYCKRNGGSFDELCSTYSVATTRGGIHLYFRWERPVAASQASIVKGVLDVRTNGGASGGGYVLAAGSRTAAGPYRVMADKPILACPAWLADLVEEKPYVPRGRLSATDAYMESSGSFAGLTRLVRQAQEGNRNNALLYAARAMCSDGASEDDAHDYLADAALSVGLTDREIRGTIRSAFRLQHHKEGT